MKMKAHYNPKSTKWLISFAVMLVLCEVVVFASIGITSYVDKNSKSVVDVSFTADSPKIPIAVQENDFCVTGVEKIMDKNEIVGYAITSSVVGYNQESPILMKTIMTKDAKVVAEIDILEQEETEYLGVRITTDEFKNQFSGRKLPVCDSSSIEKGTKVDVISGSTISSVAVIDGVNGAMNYVNTFLAE